jgi:hypothetical protein
MGEPYELKCTIWGGIAQLSANSQSAASLRGEICLFRIDAGELPSAVSARLPAHSFRSCFRFGKEAFGEAIVLRALTAVKNEGNHTMEGGRVPISKHKKEHGCG